MRESSQTHTSSYINSCLKGLCKPVMASVSTRLSDIKCLIFFLLPRIAGGEEEVTLGCMCVTGTWPCFVLACLSGLWAITERGVMATKRVTQVARAVPGEQKTIQGMD